MERKVQYTNSPPSYAPPSSDPYPPAGATPNPYPAPGPAPYPPSGPYGQQPPAGYPPQPGYGIPQCVASPQQQQQQQPVLVVTAGQDVQSYGRHMMFAVIVAWCCNCPFGLIAFILAMLASRNAVSDPGSARNLGRASMGMSVAGIVVTVVIIIIVLSVSLCAYSYNGVCYSRRKNVRYYDYCYGIRSGSFCYYD